MKRKVLYSVLALLLLGGMLFAAVKLDLFSGPEPSHHLTEYPLEVHFLSVGDADAIVVVCDNHVMVIDGGGYENGQTDIRTYLQQTLNVNTIDYLVATHPDKDHVDTLPSVVVNYKVGKVFVSQESAYEGQNAFNKLLDYSRSQKTKLCIPAQGETIELGKARITFLTDILPEYNTNQASLTLMLEYGKTKYLFMADADFVAENALIRSSFDLSADVLKVGHHGAETSTSVELLHNVFPEYAIISAGGNTHPTETVLGKLNEIGAQTLCTYQLGTIIMASDGEKIHPALLSKAPGADGTEKPDKPVPKSWLVAEDPTEAHYIGNRNSMVYHEADCQNGARVKDTNKVFFSTAQDAEASGFRHAQCCKSE